MTPERAARAAIAARAGVKKGEVTVYFSADTNRPPTLQRVDPWGKPVAGHGRVPASHRHKRLTRRVVVGAQWLRDHAPELWSVFVAAKLVDGAGADIPNPVPRPR